MIKLCLKNQPEKLFNLNDFETEKKLEAAWKSMAGEEKYENKRFNITTDTGEKLSLLIGEIEDCKFDDCEYIKAEVHTKRDEPKKEKSMAEIIRESAIQEGDRKTELLLNEIRKRNVPIDLTDPRLQMAIKYVKEDISDSRIPFYANLYANMKKAGKI